jgi:hypothetical protein
MEVRFQSASAVESYITAGPRICMRTRSEIADILPSVAENREVYGNNDNNVTPAGSVEFMATVGRQQCPEHYHKIYSGL